jgi:hemolysin III
MARVWRNEAEFSSPVAKSLPEREPRIRDMILDPPSRSKLCDSPREEMASFVTHAVATLLSVLALVLMLQHVAGDGLKIVATSVFGGSLILLYAASSLYHYSTSLRWKSRFRVLDHACIYLLIAGSYTPVTLLTLRGAVGGWLLGTVWLLALMGVLVKTLHRGKKSHWVSTLLYLAMGWLILFALKPLMRELPAVGVWLYVAGGFTYSFGIIFYAWRRLPYNHAIWHLFVMGGSGCHVLAVLLYVLS